MSAGLFPTKLADLSLNDGAHNPSIYASIKSIRRATLSIPNRLRSVLADAAFAKEVAQQYNLPLIANERCGSWYIDPADKVGSAYFKSTDGHHGQWDFSLRRLNLQLFPVLGRSGGAVVVDSTRRGKNLPDAFSKTVPIWAAVVNRALFPDLKEFHALQHPPPPDDLGLSELSQIESRIKAFVRSFSQLGLDLDALRSQLRSPIRLNWAINGQHTTRSNGFEIDESTESTISMADNRQINQLVLCSASRRVRGAEVSEGGYIQGAGDDSEGWSRGLTAQVFWKHKDELLSSAEEELESFIERLIQRDKDEMSGDMEATELSAAKQLHIAAGHVGNARAYALVVNCEGGEEVASTYKVLNLNCRTGKLGSRDLREKLALACNTISQQLCTNPDGQVLVTCSTGKDLCVGVLVAVLCLVYDDDGQLRKNTNKPSVDKNLVKQRLAWISTSKPDANPSRATLQAVNSFLMHRPG